MKLNFFHILFFTLLAFGSDAQKQYKKFVYDNGSTSSEGYMVDGKPDGYWKTYYPDGGLKTEGNRKEFKLDSTWKFYREDSTLERIITYANDLKNGLEQTFLKTGKEKDELLFVNNIKNGEAKYFYESGQLWKRVNFQNNKEEGKAVEYAEDGRIITLLTYRNGFMYTEERINRYNSEAKRTGIWQDLYPNGRIKEEGPWTNGERNGVFKFFNKKGELEKLEKYENGVLVTEDGNSETAILDIRKEYYEDGSIRVVGSYSGGKKKGTFREYDKEGKEINGYLYDNDRKMGEGMLDSLGRRIGAWKLYHTSGELRAEGEYIEGLKEGPWTFYFVNGSTEQKGSYKGDLPTGQWKWFFANGTMHREEIYRKGKEDGHAVEYDSAGVVINEGDYSMGNKNGIWKLTVNDHTEEGEYQDGERNGPWVWKYANGKEAFEGEYQAGIPVGKHKYYYENGQTKMKGGYEGGELNGKWDYFQETGLLDLSVDYDLGIAVKINGHKIKLREPEEEK